MRFISWIKYLFIKPDRRPICPVYYVDFRAKKLTKVA